MHLPPPTRRYTDYGPYPTPLMSLKLQLHTSQGYGDTHTDTCTHFSTSRPNYRSSITEWLHVHHHYGDFGSNVSAPPSGAANRATAPRKVLPCRYPVKHAHSHSLSHTHSLSHCRRPSTKLGIFLSFFLWRSLTGGCRPTSTTPWGERGSKRRRRHSGPAHSVLLSE